MVPLLSPFVFGVSGRLWSSGESRGPQYPLSATAPSLHLGAQWGPQWGLGGVGGVCSARITTALIPNPNPPSFEIKVHRIPRDKEPHRDSLQGLWDPQPLSTSLTVECCSSASELRAESLKMGTALGGGGKDGGDPQGRCIWGRRDPQGTLSREGAAGTSLQGMVPPRWEASGDTRRKVLRGTGGPGNPPGRGLCSLRQRGTHPQG